MAEARRAGHRVLGRLQQSVINPVVRLAWDLGIPVPGDAPAGDYRTADRNAAAYPVCDGFDDETFWLVAQRGRSADWVRNIEADPRVRIRVNGLRAGWRAGTAHSLDGDDPQQRQRILAALIPRADPAYARPSRSTQLR
jgi:F420H(2)-dependent quinone reductase